VFVCGAYVDTNKTKNTNTKKFVRRDADKGASASSALFHLMLTYLRSDMLRYGVA
jgi:hypothetical protein